MSLAGFISPEGVLYDEIVFWKNRIEKEYPNQPYTLHPPHMTILNIEVIDEKDGVDCILKMIKNIDPFQISIQSKEVFSNDNLTGRETLFFRVDMHESLISLQKLIAESLKPIRKKLPTPKKYIKMDKEYLDSYKTYGYPFIGRHWIPHFTVSSLKIKKSESIIKDFLATKPSYNFLVDKFSIWRIDGDEHVKLKTINFR